MIGTPPTAVFVGKLTEFAAAAAVDGGFGWLATLAVVNTAARATLLLGVAAGAVIPLLGGPTFCRIPIDARVSHPTTLMKLTTRYGTAAVDGCNEALLAKAVADSRGRTRVQAVGATRPKVRDRSGSAGTRAGPKRWCGGSSGNWPGWAIGQPARF